MALQSEHSSSRRSVRWFTSTAALEAVGDSVARSVLPIVAVTTLGAGTATVGVINSLGLAAFLLLSLPIGVLADRWSAPRRLMTLSSLVRAGVMTAGLAAWIAGWLHGAGGLAVVLTMALMVGVADVGFTAGQALLVPRLVPPDRLRPVFGRLQSVSQAGGAAGPAVLTGLLAVIAAPAAWAVSAVLYLCSAVTQRRIRETVPPPAPPPRATMWAQARAGTGELFAHPVLARITVANTLNNAAVMGANTLLPVIVLRELDLAPAVFTAIGTTGALAGIAGASLASTITARIGLRATRLGTSIALTLGIVAVVAAVGGVLPGHPVLWLTLQSALAGAGTAIALVAGSDLAPRLVPGHALGTVMGAQRALVLGVMPIAALALGALGAVSVTAATWVWLALAAASVLPCLRLTDPPASR